MVFRRQPQQGQQQLPGGDIQAHPIHEDDEDNNLIGFIGSLQMMLQNSF